MGRREAREAALQILFQIEFDELKETSSLEHFWPNRESQSNKYVRELVEGVLSNKVEIDSLIQSYSKNWRISRMLLIDRNVLRMAVYEMLFEEGMAAAIVINEAVELAKKFGSSDSAKFINGILDALSKDPRIQNKIRGSSNG